MSFIEELRWRGMLHDSTPGIEDELAKNICRAYVGFDPTAPSLTIGNLVPIMLLAHFQRAGHQPIVLLGGATGRIGDPSGKDAERQLKTYEELDNNLAHQSKQFAKFLRFDESENTALLVNNYDFYKEMNVLIFLRDIGKSITINTMLAKDSVKNRLESGLSFTEFSYQLLQGYDFQYLYQKMNCKIQMGGSDQWGNIVGGTEFIRKNLSGKAYALTTPLLLKADGQKFGKSNKGNIWLDANLTSPYSFYQFWINADDADIMRYLKIFSLKTQEALQQIEREHQEAPHFRNAQKALAEELTIRVHSEEDYQSALLVTELLFGKNVGIDQLHALNQRAFQAISEEIPSYTIRQEILQQGVSIGELLAEQTKILASKGEVRRAIQNNAISINKEKIKSVEATIRAEQLLHEKYLLVENGKKNKYLLVAEI